MIYQDENQFSRLDGLGGIYREIIAPLVHEKYVAFCEGDDFWTDPNKIQVQAEYMESHPDCSMCVHDTMLVNLDGEKLRRLNGSDQDQDYGMREMLLGGGRYFHTTSFFCKRETAFERSKEFYMAWVDDWALSIYATTLGKIHYIARVMSCFRSGNPESQTSQAEKHFEIWLHHWTSVIKYLREINEHTNRAFDDILSPRIASFDCWRLFYQKEYVQAFLKYPYYSLRHIAVIMLRKLKILR